jgi:rSAM/selenodomain-associated transferase 2
VLSAVVPTLNAAGTLPGALAPLTGAGCEIVVADGGSTDATRQIAEKAGARVIESPPGRGVQLRAGCAAASGDWLLVLHADTRLGPGWEAAAQEHMARAADRAGYFRLAFDDPSAVARLWERGVRWRAEVLHLPYGDQGLLIARSLYEAVGGFPAWPLMEDVDMVRRLGAERLAPLTATAITSADKYRRDGWMRRSLGHWVTLARWRLGADPAVLARGHG